MSALSDFWKNFQPYEDDIVGKTCIAKQDYEILKQEHKLVSQAEWDNDPKSILLHSDLPAEPFVGDLDAGVYIITLNPGVGEDEYKNWENQTLKDLAEHCQIQGPTEYPFYYLNQKLKGTGGARYWIEKAPGQPWFYNKFYDLANALAPRFGGVDNAIKKIAQNVCDLEFCPYHSRKWGDDKCITKLPSVVALIDFIKTVVVPGVVSGDKALIVGRRVREINNLLGGTTFKYNGKDIVFDELEKLFPDRVIFNRNRTESQLMRFDSGSRAWNILLNRVK